MIKYTHIEILCQQKPITYNLKTLSMLKYYLILIDCKCVCLLLSSIIIHHRLNVNILIDVNKNHQVYFIVRMNVYVSNFVLTKTLQSKLFR